MPDCATCCKGTFLTVLSIFTLGISLAIFIFATIIYNLIKSINNTIFIVLIVLSVLTGLLFFFSIYASCCGKKCAKVFLSFVYIIYAIILGAMGIAALIFKAKINGFITDTYYSYKFTDKDLEAVSKSFKCSFPPLNNNTTPETPAAASLDLLLLENNSTNADNCINLIDSYVSKYGLIIGIVLIVLFVVLMIGVIFACRIVCKHGGDKRSDESPSPKGTLIAPLTYGW